MTDRELTEQLAELMDEYFEETVYEAIAQGLYWPGLQDGEHLYH